MKKVFTPLIACLICCPAFSQSQDATVKNDNKENVQTKQFVNKQETTPAKVKAHKVDKNNKKGTAAKATKSPEKVGSRPGPTTNGGGKPHPPKPTVEGTIK